MDDTYTNRSEIGDQITPVSEPGSPQWFPMERELWYRGKLVKRYVVPAPIQELILQSFHEQGWPRGIDNPIPPSDIPCKLRLASAIKCLNRSMRNNVLKFHGNGTGKVIIWR